MHNVSLSEYGAVSCFTMGVGICGLPLHEYSGVTAALDRPRVWVSMFSF